jgi:flagellar biosynthetic protein FliR
MSLRIDIGWLIAALLVSLRVAAATMLAPVFGPTQIPAFVRVLLALTLAAVFVSAIPVPSVPLTSSIELAVAAASELLIGACLSFGFLAAYAATQVAGRALDVQMGFGVASVINPSAQGFSPLLGTFFGMATVAVFLALDGHHVLVRALALSLQSTPPGVAAYSSDWDAVLAQSRVMFTFGLALAAPVMFALLLADVALAMLARSMPMLNVFVFSFSLKIVLGLTALAASIKLAEPLLTALFDTTFHYWDQAVAHP